MSMSMYQACGLFHQNVEQPARDPRKAAARTGKEIDEAAFVEARLFPTVAPLAPGADHRPGQRLCAPGRRRAAHVRDNEQPLADLTTASRALSTSSH